MEKELVSPSSLCRLPEPLSLPLTRAFPPALRHSRPLSSHWPASAGGSRAGESSTEEEAQG